MKTTREIFCGNFETLKKAGAAIVLLILCGAAGTSIFAQTTEFTYQGKLADTGTPLAAYDFEFRLCASETSCSTPLAVDPHSAVTVSSGGIFTVKLNFGATLFDGSDRFLEIAVKRPTDTNYTTLAPRQKLTSAPYTIQSLKASDAQNLGGTAANQYVKTDDPRLDANNYVQNTTAAQSSGNFNIGGTGTANVLNASTQFNIGGSRILSVAGNSNLFAGIGAGAANTGSYNSFVGNSAGSANTSASFNSFFGALAGQSNTTGFNNSFFGVSAGRVNTSGSDNSIFGVNAGVANTTGDSGAFFGSGAGRGNTSGDNNSFFGTDAGMKNTTGFQNSFFGTDAGMNNTTGNFNSFFGRSTGISNTTGGSNSFFGQNAGVSTTTGNSNSFYGQSAGLGNSTGSDNSFYGYFAGQATTLGGSNSFFGRFAGDVNKTGSNNTIIGATANVGADNLTNATAIGSGAIVNSSNTVVLGRSADTVQIPGTLNISGTFSTNIFNAQTQINLGGNRILSAGGTGNLFAGVGAGNSNSSGLDNSFFGVSAGNKNTSGRQNSFFGVRAGENNSTGIGNVFVGSQTGRNNTGGNQNLFIGNDAGYNSTTGSDNIFIGNSATNASVNTQINNSIAIGNSVTVAASNTIALGGTNQKTIMSGGFDVRDGTSTQTSIVRTTSTTQFGKGLFVYSLFFQHPETIFSAAHLCFDHTNSDPAIPESYYVLTYCSSSSAAQRYKTDVKPFSGGLDIIKRLKPVAFKWKKSGESSIGLNAEDVAAVEPELITLNDKGEVQDVKEDGLNILLINAVKEQQKQIETQQKQIDALKKLVCATAPQAEICQEKENEK